MTLSRKAVADYRFLISFNEFRFFIIYHHLAMVTCHMQPPDISLKKEFAAMRTAIFF